MKSLMNAVKEITKTGEFSVISLTQGRLYHREICVKFGYRGYEISRGMDSSVHVYDYNTLVYDTGDYEISGIIKAVEFIDNLHSVEAMEK